MVTIAMIVTWIVAWTGVVTGLTMIALACRALTSWLDS